MTAADAAKLARTAGVKAVHQGREAQARHHPHAGVPRPDQARRDLGPARRAEPRRRRRRRRRRPRLRPVAGVPVGRPAGNPQAGAAVLRHLPDRRAVDASDCTTKSSAPATTPRASPPGSATSRPSSRTSTCPPRDADGHGTHTSTTAAGNYGVPVTVDGQAFGKASGMAPQRPASRSTRSAGAGPRPEAGCYTSDSVQAIEDATTDGVDVINFSISGSPTSSSTRSSSPSSAPPRPASSSPPRPATPARARARSRTTARG